MTRIKLNPDGMVDDIRAAVLVLRMGGLIIFPAERLYGMGADAHNPVAARAIFELKDRPANRPLPVIVDTIEEAKKWAEFSPAAERLADFFWPGPLTLVLPYKGGLAPEVTAGSEKIGIRVPGSSVALKLAAQFGGPITATSANLSGEDACFFLDGDSDLVTTGINAGIDLVLDDGLLPGPPGSTVVEVEGDHVNVLREGAVNIREIEPNKGGQGMT